ncbi:carbohydrate kinase family protein [Cochlodiniinecator piscidefendens]|uniref:carbohydrate kinase family protein n=1 Tax=Cochlodiniinecator piscidefendens TaxID=2715756 RepID=UPI001408371D|nr:PfkB family carbohydrate kinase [Cochlodiniinecator piscidefendens]
MMDALNKMGGVLSVGRLYCDLVFTGVPRLPTMGTEVFSDGLQIHAGGGAYITGATIRALGRPAALASTLPAAPFDHVLSAQLSMSGLDTTRCVPADSGSDPQITVAITNGADRAFLTRADGPALGNVTYESLNNSGISHLHIGELRTLVEHPELISLARTLGLTISLDCSWEDALPDMASELINAVDVFLPNEEEHMRLLQSGINLKPELLTVVKQGKLGATAIWDGNELYANAKPTQVVDTTGAGDAFNGGFLHKWLSDEPLETALECANDCGTSAVSVVGGTGWLGTVRCP